MTSEGRYTNECRKRAEKDKSEVLMGGKRRGPTSLGTR
jgi:hypothetical protein